MRVVLSLVIGLFCFNASALFATELEPFKSALISVSSTEAIHFNYRVKEDISKTIVRVKSGSKYSTGFFFKNGKQVITTLHSIGNPDQIEVYIPSKQSWCDVTLKRISKKSDLVLLEMQNCESQNFIKSENIAATSIDTKVFTIGYYGSNEKFQDRDFLVGLLEGKRLKDLLEPSAELEIKNLGFPSLETEIVYLKGQLLHGFSGSPIVDYEGKLIGIADGGLENGAAGISWCITATQLRSVETSTDTFPRSSLKKVKTLFAAEEIPAESEAITNGIFSFELIKSRTFEELNNTGNYTQYPEMGMYQIMTALDQEGINYRDFEFNIYLESTTGATIALPKGLKLMQENGMFYATTANNDTAILITLYNTYNPQQTSIEFENMLQLATNIYSWSIDTRLSFLIPYYRPDNVIINRKAFYNYEPNRYIIEALAVKENVFFGVATLFKDLFDFNSYEFTNSDLAAQYILASQLTTFTN